MMDYAMSIPSLASELTHDTVLQTGATAHINAYVLAKLEYYNYFQVAVKKKDRRRV
jgi:hypothetical protein